MFEPYIKSGKRALQLLRDYRILAQRVKDVVRKGHPHAHVYVFGSVLEGRVTASSDIDILIVCDGLTDEQATRLKVEVLRRIGRSTPVELHIASKKEFEGWYRRFIGKIEEV